MHIFLIASITWGCSSIKEKLNDLDEKNRDSIQNEWEDLNSESDKFVLKKGHLDTPRPISKKVLSNKILPIRLRLDNSSSPRKVKLARKVLGNKDCNVPKVKATKRKPSNTKPNRRFSGMRGNLKNNSKLTNKNVIRKKQKEIADIEIKLSQIENRIKVNLRRIEESQNLGQKLKLTQENKQIESEIPILKKRISSKKIELNSLQNKQEIKKRIAIENKALASIIKSLKETR